MQSISEFLETEEAAFKAIRLLKLHLDGGEDDKLNAIEIETYRQIVKSHAIHFDFFTLHILGFDRYKKTHSRWCKKHEKDFYRKKNFLRLKPRGTGKTTIYGIAQVLWIWAVMSQEIRIFYSSANSLLLAEVSDSIRRILLPGNASFYSFIYGITLDKDSKNTDEIINITGRGDAKGFSLVFRPSGSSTAGVHPNVILVDDPCDKDDRTSAATRKYKKVWADTLRPLLNPMTLENGFTVEHFEVIATRWHMDDVNQYFIEQNKKLPKSHQFDVEVESLEDSSTGKNNFTEIYTKKEISVLKAQLDPIFYSCQMNNMVLPEGTMIFDIDQFHFNYIRSDKNPHGIDIQNGSNYCFIDPSKGNKESDFPATIFVNRQGDKIFIFDAITVIKPFSRILDDVIRMSVKYGVIEIIYEDNGTNLIEEGLKSRIEKHNQNIEIANSVGDRSHAAEKYYATIKGQNEKRNKPERIRNMQPAIVSGDVIFRSDWQIVYEELMNQTVYYPAWGYDDFPDIIEKAIRYLVKHNFTFEVFKAR